MKTTLGRFCRDKKDTHTALSPSLRQSQSLAGCLPCRLPPQQGHRRPLGDFPGAKAPLIALRRDLLSYKPPDPTQLLADRENLCIGARVPGYPKEEPEDPPEDVWRGGGSGSWAAAGSPLRPHVGDLGK